MNVVNLQKGTTNFSWLFEQNCYLPQTQGIRSLKAGGGYRKYPKNHSGDQE